MKRYDLENVKNNKESGFQAELGIAEVVHNNTASFDDLFSKFWIKKL